MVANQKRSRAMYFVFRAFPPTWGIKRSTPNGAFLSFK